MPAKPAIISGAPKASMVRSSGLLKALNGGHSGKQDQQLHAGADQVDEEHVAHAEAGSYTASISALLRLRCTSSCSTGR